MISSVLGQKMKISNAMIAKTPTMVQISPDPRIPTHLLAMLVGVPRA